MHILANYPLQLRQKLRFLKESFCHVNNEYPDFLVDKWFSQFRSDVCRNPGLLKVCSRLIAEDLFDEHGCQRFPWPSAKNRFPPVQIEVEINEGTSCELELQATIYAKLFEDLPEGLNT